jgi:CBS domain-containing protein
MSHEVPGIPPDSSLQAAAQLMAEESFSCLLVTRDDESLSPVRQPDGGVTHFLSIEEDISEKKRTQAELERHRQRLETLVGERAIQLLQAAGRPSRPPAEPDDPSFVRIHAQDILHLHEPVLRQAMCGAFVNFERLVADFDFEAARNLLHRLFPPAADPEGNDE